MLYSDQLQGTNEEVTAMTRVLVGLEMFHCNKNPGQMEFSLPALSAVCTVLLLSCCPTVAVVQMVKTDVSVTRGPHRACLHLNTFQHHQTASDTSLSGFS